MPKEPTAKVGQEEPLPAQQDSEAPAAAEDSAGDQPPVETPEDLPRVHPSAVPGETPVAPQGIEPAYYIGQWGPHPLYGCPYCPHSVAGADGAGVIELHILNKIDAGDFEHSKALALKE